jgi:Mg-chelatase subunit ChlD
MAAFIASHAQVSCSPIRVTAMEENLLVTNLSAGDLAAKLNGQPVRITSAEVGTGSRFVLVLDSSGSMSGTTSTSPPFPRKRQSERRNWLLVLQLAEIIVASAPKNSAIGIITFGDSVSESVPLHESRVPLQEALERERQNLRAPFGKSALWDAIDKAIGMLKPAQEGDFILVISDAGDNQSKISFHDLGSELLAQRIRLLPILSISGPPLTEEERLGPSAMEMLAKSSGGLVFSINPRSWASRPPAESSEFLASLARSVLAVATYSYILSLDVPDLSKKQKLRIESAGGQLGRKRLKLYYPPEIGPCRSDRPAQ